MISKKIFMRVMPIVALTPIGFVISCNAFEKHDDVIINEKDVIISLLSGKTKDNIMKAAKALQHNISDLKLQDKLSDVLIADSVNLPIAFDGFFMNPQKIIINKDGFTIVYKINLDSS